MPEGPFGFPRLTSIGPFVDEYRNPAHLLKDIMKRPHSWRHYEPQEFQYLIDEEYKKSRVRQELRGIEAGRFHEYLENAHEFWWPLDVDEKVEFAEKNPRLVQWIEVYAQLEDQSLPSKDVEVY